MTQQKRTDVDWLQGAVAEHEGRLLQYARHLTGDIDRARDAVQDTFLQLCRQKREKVEGHLAPWLFTVCRNRAFEMKRKDKRMQGLPDEQKVKSPTSPPDAAAERALDDLSAGGSTAGGAGIKLAYDLARRHLDLDGVNRVVLCTDGDFNVGMTDTGQLVELVKEKARSSISLTVLGFGMGNYQDALLEKLADNGDGNYGYVDSFKEARKLLVDQLTSTLVTIARDVKIQVAFNPDRVARYRLVGYENRLLEKEDFEDDTKDAGEIGAGHTVTALYEVVPVERGSGETLTLKLRYKQPDSDTSRELEFELKDGNTTFEQASRDFRFAASVAAFGMLLRDSPYKGSMTYGDVLEIGDAAQGQDVHGYRREFLELVRNAKAIGGGK